MIYTVTFNPALDYVIRVNQFALGEVNRTVQEHVFYGGKGINVSTVLARLGFENTALGFVAGFTGAEIERGAAGLGFTGDFIHVEKGMTRINVKLKAEEETEINGMGPEIQRKEVQQLFEKLDRMKSGDVLVLSGSIPASISDRIYEEIMARLEGRGIRIVVDATKDLLLNVLKYKPFFVKPNNHELGEIYGVELKTREDVVPYAKKMQQEGARNVLVSMAGEGAVLVAENGEVYKSKCPEGKVKNSVGAGDSMVAGFIAGYLKSGDYKEALRNGLLTGSASAFSDNLATKEEVENLGKTFEM